MHRMARFPLFPVLLLAVASALVPLTVADPQATLLNLGCSQYNATPTAGFLAALNATFAELRANLSAGGGFATASQPRAAAPAFAMAQCRPYVTGRDCVACFDAAAARIRTSCGAANGGRAILDGCVIRYESAAFFDQTTLPGNTQLCNGSAVAGGGFDGAVRALVSDLTAVVPRVPGLAAAAAGSGVYAMAQCVETVGASGCAQCLEVASRNIDACSPNSDGRAVDAGCFMRYSDKRFFPANATVDLAPYLRSDPGSKRTTFTKIVLIGSTSAAATLLFPCIYFLIWHRKGKRLWFRLCKKTSSNTEKNYEAMIVSYGPLAPQRYMYSEVMKITSFRSDQLGRGGYGVVFKGRLHDGRLVAVKFLHDCKGNGDEFVNEVMSIGRTSHVNVVRLHGFCLEGSKRALIYEYMSNGSLDKYIYSENPKEILGWERLYAIAIGIARGLEYLHHSCNTRIVHFDIKPQNILLDKDFNPKIADFGLAKLCHTKESKLSMTGARGTIGFIAPEVHSRTFGVVSTKSDVYSYGMMMLEMVGGRRNVKSIVEKSSEKYFPDWIYDHLAHDDGLQACEVTGEIEEIARKMILTGLWCIQVIPMYRPTITKVLEMFERSLDDLDMPPKQNFCELLENSPRNMDVQSASSTGPEEIIIVNPKTQQ